MRKRSILYFCSSFILIACGNIKYRCWEGGRILCVRAWARRVYVNHTYIPEETAALCADILKEWEIKHTGTQDHKLPPAPSLAGAEPATRYLLRSPAEGEWVWERGFHKVWSAVTWAPSRQPRCLAVRHGGVCVRVCVCGRECVCFEMGWVTCCHTLVTTVGIRPVCVCRLQILLNHSEIPVSVSIHRFLFKNVFIFLQRPLFSLKLI